MKGTHIRVSGWEEHLIRRAQSGDTVARELLLDEYRGCVWGHALRMLRDHDDAHDAVQETFVKAFRGLGGFEPGRPFSRWLLRICANCCVDILRARKRAGECIDRHEHSLVDEREDVAECVAHRHRMDRIQQAIWRLPVRYREIILMRHYRHMEVNEIALALDRPEGTVKSWLFRARALLRKDLLTAPI